MPEGFRSIKEVFNNEPALSKIREVLNSSDVVKDFEKIFPELKQIVRPAKAEKKILTLKVENAAWRNELKFKENEIIEKINSFYGEERINKIKFSAK